MLWQVYDAVSEAGKSKVRRRSPKIAGFRVWTMHHSTKIPTMPAFPRGRTLEQSWPGLGFRCACSRRRFFFPTPDLLGPRVERQRAVSSPQRNTSTVTSMRTRIIQNLPAQSLLFSPPITQKCRKKSSRPGVAPYEFVTTTPPRTHTLMSLKEVLPRCCQPDLPR